ncbi:GGDEF domain-containing protein [Thalassolituus sp. UBA3500]|jgi:diguanylate cyclase (GGDEF)-like protein|uniref:GGDEF domain-containing protein n=2 Tax=unclassified Thalassolituus TaxID=2624967 RepID=UPI0023B46BD0|nr:GGDEF domain-containing protein [Thalassolituus sp. UBA3500]|tara:strand:+ start:201 stop:857 length:657 start_codon:yes stop_codon:yes gene_type:complete
MSPEDMSVEKLSCPVGESHCVLFDEVATLRKQVVTDPLTGLFNVRHFRKSLEHELERTRRTGMTTALVMVDLDHFKSVNDTWGHEAGNLVLQTVAQLLQDQTRKLDICCRYGGEEFAVILPSTELMLARQVAERCLNALRNTLIPLESTDLQVTASIGVAVADNSSQTSDRLIEDADECMYDAKKGGRNQVVSKRPQPSQSAVSIDERDALRGLFGDD